jgi:hypothetical protein
MTHAYFCFRHYPWRLAYRLARRAVWQAYLRAFPTFHCVLKVLDAEFPKDCPHQ